MYIEQNSQVEEKMNEIEAFGVSRQCKTIIFIRFTSATASLFPLEISFMQRKTVQEKIIYQVYVL